MLIQFSVTNFRSFYKKTTFSMLAGSDTTSLPSHVYRKIEDTPLLRAAAIYGANASGKSNLVAAMAWSKNFILLGNASPALQPFRLDKECLSSPSEFEYIFYTNDTCYTYGFVVDSQKVHKEWLYAATNSGEETLYERETLADGTVRVTLGETAKSHAEEAQFLHFLAQITRREQLFLTKAILEKNEKMRLYEEAESWFGDSLLIVGAEQEFLPIDMLIGFSAKFQEQLGRSLKDFGLDISFVRIGAEPLRNSELIPLDIREKILANPPPKKSVQSVPATATSPRCVILRENSDDLFIGKILTHRENRQGEDVRFELEDESDGTQRLMALYPLLLFLRGDLLEGGDHSRVVVIDELDRRLHTLLSQQFVKRGLGDSNDPLPTQLIFTTHDTNLLDLKLLRSDEIWFVEKDDFGATQISSLVEYNYPEGVNIEKGYLQGRFGGVPYLEELHLLTPEASHATS